MDWPTSDCSKGKDVRHLTRTFTVVLWLGLCVSCSVAGPSGRALRRAVVGVYLNKVLFWTKDVLVVLLFRSKLCTHPCQILSGRLKYPLIGLACKERVFKFKKV